MISFLSPLILARATAAIAPVTLHQLKEVRMRSGGFFFSRISGLLLAATPHAQINEGTIIGTVQVAAGAAVRSQIQ